MEVVLALTADDTHLYPGARLTADGEVLQSEPTETVVVFRDHSHAEAVLRPSSEAFVLAVEGYSTAAGTAIRGKSWRLRVADDGSLSVKSRAD